VKDFKGRGIVVKMQGGGSYPKNAKIDHNYLHDARGNEDHDAEAIQIGQSFNNTDQSANAIVEYNLLQRVSVDPEAISIKSSGNTIRYNTLVDSDANIMIRHGENNLIAGNWCENSRGIVVHDADNKVVGNKCKNSGYYGIRIMGGNLKPGVTSGSGYPYADGTLVSGNDSDRLIIGQTFAGSLSARNTRIEAHKGPIQRGNDVGTTIVSSRSVTAPTPKKLSSSDVGP